MTVEEIKQTIPMREVLERYGVKVNRNGMCCCPIHHEQHPSMKVFQDGYKCFACNSKGDVIKFVQEMEGCNFKTAFLMLGGTYENKPERARLTAKVSFERQRKLRQKSIENENLFREYLMGAIDLCNWWIANKEPFSDDWCYAQNNIQCLWHVYETKYLEGEKVEEVNVFRKCKAIRQRFITV